MGNKSSSSNNLICKNWQKVSASVYRNILTSQLVKQNVIKFADQQQFSSSFKRYIQRANLCQFDIIKLVYFTKQSQVPSICTSSNDQHLLSVYTEFVPHNLDIFIQKFKQKYINQRAQDCFCQSIIKSAVYLRQKYDFFRLTSKTIWIDKVQNKKSLKKYRVKIWVNENGFSCQPQQKCTEKQMVQTIKCLIQQKIISNQFCSKLKNERFSNNFKFAKTLNQLVQIINESHFNSKIKNANDTETGKQNNSRNIRAYSINSQDMQNSNCKQLLENKNKTSSFRETHKKVSIQSTKVPSSSFIVQNVKHQTYILNNHQQTKQKPNALTKFFADNYKINQIYISPYKNQKINTYKQQSIHPNQQYSYHSLIDKHLKMKTGNIIESNVKINFSNTRQITNNQNQKKIIQIKQFACNQKVQDLTDRRNPTDRSKNSISLKNQQRKQNSAVNSSRKNICMMPNSLSSTYGASQFPRLKSQKQEYQISSYIKQVPEKTQGQKLQKRHSSKEHICMKQQQSNSSKAHSSNIIICQEEVNSLNRQFELDKKYEKYCNKLIKISEDRKVQNQMESIRNSKIKDKKHLQNMVTGPIRTQSIKMAKSINFQSELNESIDAQKQKYEQQNTSKEKHINLNVINNIQERQSFNFQFDDPKEQKFIRTGSEQYVTTQKIKKQKDSIKHVKQNSQIPSLNNQAVSKMQKKNISLNLKDQLNNIFQNNNINKSYSYKGYSYNRDPSIFQNKAKQLLDSLSNNKSGINAQINSVYNQSISNLSTPDDQEESLKKSKREKDIIKQEMQFLLRVTISNQDDHSVKAKVKHKRQIFSELKAEALKILD